MLSDEVRNAIALKRFSLISPILNGQVNNRREYYVQISSNPIEMPHYGIRKYSPKTIESWYCDYMRGGLDALKPGYRSDKGNSRKTDAELAEKILQIKKAYPKAANTIIYDKLIEEGVLKEDQISLTTLYRFLNSSNCRSIHETQEKKEIKRFAHQYINELWHGDLMYGPYIQDGRKKKPTYLLAYIDDASRIIPHGEFYYTQNLESLRHSFKEAVLKRGIPSMLYTDNGKIYRSQQFEFMCANIGCTLIHSKPFVAHTRGKVERFFLTVRKRFLSQLDMNNIRSLEDLNLKFWKWLDEDYHKKPHSSLNGLTPLDFFMSQISRVKLCTDPAQLEEKLLLRIKRKVNHDGTFPINNILYETDIKFAGLRVEVRYDPQWLDIPFMPVFIYQEDKKIGEALQVNFHDNAHIKRRGKPENPELTVDLQDNEISVTSIDTQKSKRTISFTTIMEGEK
ncbi:MAG: DDE-type integrase/transposase/recombinase [Clostridium sp.]|jgi:putative transposase|nr:DDE-type integrase/transposase/recombinase [Clostridium sp.]